MYAFLALERVVSHTRTSRRRRCFGGGGGDRPAAIAPTTDETGPTRDDGAVSVRAERPLRFFFLERTQYLSNAHNFSNADEAADLARPTIVAIVFALSTSPEAPMCTHARVDAPDDRANARTASNARHVRVLCTVLNVFRLRALLRASSR